MFWNNCVLFLQREENNQKGETTSCIVLPKLIFYDHAVPNILSGKKKKKYSFSTRPTISLATPSGGEKSSARPTSKFLPAKTGDDGPLFTTATSSFRLVDNLGRQRRALVVSSAVLPFYQQHPTLVNDSGVLLPPNKMFSPATSRHRAATGKICHLQQYPSLASENARGEMSCD